MQTITDHANTDDRLRDVTLADEDHKVLMERASAPVLATPVAVALFTAGVALEEAADN